MTVIAWDCNLLVTDGRSTRGTEIVTDKAVKIKKFNHAELGEVHGAFCGLSMAVQPWIDHMEEEGFEPFKLPEELKEFGGISGILITNKGKAIELDDNGLYSYIERPAALGSGCTIAQHFLNRGDDALTAVRETCASETTCGGNILAFDWRSGKFKSYVR